MKTVILLLTLATALDLTWAQREIEGFELLGPVPSFARATTKYYYISTEFVDWNTAFKSCVDQGGQLATPSNPVLDEALRQYMVTAGDFAWAGGKAVGSAWRWQTTDQAFTYTMFTTYPSCKNVDSCLHIGFKTDTLEWIWCGYNCIQPRKYVCEF